jgi:CRP/FNR family transcriptional regulator, cyclic AMP receptor protein
VGKDGGTGNGALTALLSLAGQAAPPALLQALIAAGSSVPARSGQLLVAAGSHSADVYIIQSGRLRVTIFSADGREVIIRDMVAGQMFGDLAAIDSGRRSASVVALEDSRLLLVPDAAFRAAALADPERAAWFAGHLVAQVRLLTERLIELSTLNVRSRLHCQLLRLSVMAGIVDNAALIHPAPSHEELADMIGTHREAITRELSYLASTGVLESGRRRLMVRDVAELGSMVRKAQGS